MDAVRRHVRAELATRDEVFVEAVASLLADLRGELNDIRRGTGLPIVIYSEPKPRVRVPAGSRPWSP
jgi:hypothetical protein